MTRSTLTLITPPASEPVSLMEAKEWARVDGTDDDAVMTGLILAARTAAEQYLRRSLITQTWRLALDSCGSGRSEFVPGVYDLPVNYFDGDMPRMLELPRGPVLSVTSVSTYGRDNTASVFAPTNYRIDAAGGRLLLNPGSYWPGDVRTEAGTEIVYVAGYGSSINVPRPIRTGILIHAAMLYESRGMCDATPGIPASAEALYAPFRVIGDRRG